MGRRDYRHHEPKKAKKNAKKASVSDIIQAPLTVEVIGKKKRKKSREEELD
jgi:hypothetical protein